MTINITFFIQIINFLVMYYILDKFLFGPVMSMLGHREHEFGDMQAAVQHEEQSVLEKERTKDADLYEFQKKVHTRVFSPPPPKVAPYDLSYHFDKRELNTLVENAKNVIVREISRVR